MKAAGRILNYESVSNLLGNSFAKDAAKIVQAANPLLKEDSKPSGAGIMGLMGQIKIFEGGSDQAKNAAQTKALGDLSWAEGLM